MAGNPSGAAVLTGDISELEDEFALDVRVIDDAEPDASMLLSTSDNCGSTCSGTACTSSLDYPA